jgi:hypothetical protein
MRSVANVGAGHADRAPVGFSAMLWFEREVVATLVSPNVDHQQRSAVESYVDDSLRAMPEHLRAGVAAESLAFGAWPRVQQLIGRLDRAALHSKIEGWKASRFDLVRQYVRLLQSLVLFAEHELTAGAAR